MSDTPKATKSRGRQSLTLNKRLTKRLASPKKRILNTEIPYKPVGIDNTDCTPPQKKLNLDDSYDSPTNFENNSPTGFLSQTLCPDSPEVGWQWSQDFESTTKSSMLDSGFSSRASSLFEVKAHSKRTNLIKSQGNVSKNDERTRAKLLELHKAEKMRAEAILRERLSKLEDQFKIASSMKSFEPTQKPVENIAESKERVEILDEIKPVTTDSDTLGMTNFSDFDSIFDESLTLESVKNGSTENSVKNKIEEIDDFFNDSDTDAMLIAATQEIESTLTKSSDVYVHEKTSEDKNKTKTVTPKTEKTKRSSLYMKFLEDDEDDLFVSLDDETLLKASQSIKTRSPFQRYKSMPAATTSASTSASNSTTITSSGTKISEYPSWSLKNGSRQTDKMLIKRHASSHVISPSSSNLRGQQLHKRN